MLGRMSLIPVPRMTFRAVYVLFEESTWAVNVVKFPVLFAVREVTVAFTKVVVLYFSIPSRAL